MNRPNDNTQPPPAFKGGQGRSTASTKDDANAIFAIAIGFLILILALMVARDVA